MKIKNVSDESPLCLLGHVVKFCLLLFIVLHANQSFSETTAEDIETLFSEEDKAENAAQEKVEKAESKVEAAPKADAKDLAGLANLAPFQDVAVIQKRFLPRTNRFELYTSGASIINDAFFLNYGLGLRLAYYFRERLGVELNGFILSTLEKQNTADLREKRGVTTDTLIHTKNYAGIDFKWTPMYGKLTVKNQKITPFDMYLSVGAGSTGTDNGSKPTVHLGTGQIFAFSKGSAWRWDFSWNMFNAPVGGGSSTALYHNLFLSVGMSFFFPEASYR